MSPRRKDKKEVKAGTGWIVTFTDLMTLLLTFFVLLFSMSSMDKVLISRISPMSASYGFITTGSAGKTPDRIIVLQEAVRDPAIMYEQEDRIKDLLFPDDVLPPGMDRSTLNKNLEILANPDGWVISLTDKLLFAPGSWELPSEGQQLLASLADVLHYTRNDVNISGHTDNTPSRGAVDNYELSAYRAHSVLEFLVSRQLAPERFSISAYGPDRPLWGNTTEDGRAANRRVEILIKTEQRLGRYL